MTKLSLIFKLFIHDNVSDHIHRGNIYKFLEWNNYKISKEETEKIKRAYKDYKNLCKTSLDFYKNLDSIASSLDQ